MDFSNIVAIIGVIVALLAVVIGAAATLLASVISPLISRGKEKTTIESDKRINQLERDTLISLLLLEIGKEEELGKEKELEEIWGQFLTESNDNNLELLLHKVKLFTDEHPADYGALVLETRITQAIEKALEAKAGRRLIGPPPRHPILYIDISLFVRMLSILKDILSVNLGKKTLYPIVTPA